MACELDGGPLCGSCFGSCRHGSPPDEPEFDPELRTVEFIINDELPVDMSDFVSDLQEEPADIPF